MTLIVDLRFYTIADMAVAGGSPPRLVRREVRFAEFAEVGEPAVGGSSAHICQVRSSLRSCRQKFV
jgi:hypothetical protein